MCQPSQYGHRYTDSRVLDSKFRSSATLSASPREANRVFGWPSRLQCDESRASSRWAGRLRGTPPVWRVGGIRQTTLAKRLLSLQFQVARLGLNPPYTGFSARVARNVGKYETVTSPS
jgi:hypothetical protein